MKCPICGIAETAVRDSRAVDDQFAIKRRRYCEGCGFRFTTFERPELKEIWVIKKHGEEEAFNREKLARSIKLAIHKRNITSEKIEAIISRIIRTLELSEDAKISTRALGEMVLRELAQIDPVAYVRFASIYEEFHNIDDFISLINGIANHA